MEHLTAERIVDARVATDARLSPDGAFVAFVLAPMGRKAKHAASAIWLAPSDGATPPRQLTAGLAEDRDPRWDADNRTLYFRSDREKKDTFQLYRIATDGGEAERLTDWQAGIADAVPLRASGELVLLAPDERPDDEKREESGEDPDVYGERWPFARPRLFDVTSRELTPLADPGERHVSDLAVSPDGARLAAVLWPTPELDSRTGPGDIVVIDRASGAVSTVTTVDAGADDLVWADNETVCFRAHLLPGMRGGQAIFTVAASGGVPRPAAHDREACPDQLVASDAGTLVVLMADHLDSSLVRLDAATGELTPIADLVGGVRALSISGDGRTLAAIRAVPEGMPDLWTSRDGARFTRITDLNPGLRDLALGHQEPVSWPAPDGMTIEGLLILPPGAKETDGPFSLVTLVHGGPYHRYDNALQLTWGAWGQWLATAGYAVLLPNPRGGSGRGHDFADRVAGRVGLEDWQDIESGIDALIARGIADPDRLGIGGWSQGGFMTAWAVGQTTRFRFGIMGAGVSDWGMMAATSDLPRFETMLGGDNAWDGPGPRQHDAVSPISFAARCQTPVLVVHGAEDARVPVSQGRFFARALREHACPCELVVYPREPHPIRERAHQLDLLRRVRAWAERWLPVEPVSGDGESSAPA